MYQKNPRSKVFAPLAESYRKLGMLDDAFKILKEGIRIHPTYALGYIVLANCYYDQEKYELTYNTLRPIVSQNADNISLQKIFAQSCIHIGNLEEALDTYKYLLFLNPQDKIFQEEVKRLEDDLQVGHKKLSLDQLIKAPNLPAQIQHEINEDDWKQVDFNHQTPILSTEEVKSIEQNDEESWVMEKPNAFPVPETVIERGLDDDFYADEFDEYGDIEEANDELSNSDSPFISHTLIDLYCSQKYYDKAIELLEKILELNPDDKATAQKLKNVLQLKGASTEAEGHEELISIIENQVKTSPANMEIAEKSFNLFLDAIKERAQQFR